MTYFVPHEENSNMLFFSDLQLTAPHLISNTWPSVDSRFKRQPADSESKYPTGCTYYSDPNVVPVVRVPFM